MQHAGSHPLPKSGAERAMEVKMLDPWYVTGLTEGEGCFSVSFNIRERLSVRIETRASFSLSMNRRDLELLKKLHQFFACGGIRFSKADNTYKFEVRNLTQLVEMVLPHFRRYPLQGAKAQDFEKFEEICRMMRANL
ncbi:MAG: LAGLIDADG family homing endonuclease, partial [Armatimonadetes bacterium]|nr:LAGLIDADG family homing endonuclease [Armatimonadota bacterium]